MKSMKIVNDLLLDTVCHSDDRREEDGLLRTPSEKSRWHKVGVPEILRRFAPLDDTTGCLPDDITKIQQRSKHIVVTCLAGYKVVEYCLYKP